MTDRSEMLGDVPLGTNLKITTKNQWTFDNKLRDTIEGGFEAVDNIGVRIYDTTTAIVIPWHQIVCITWSESHV